MPALGAPHPIEASGGLEGEGMLLSRPYARCGHISACMRRSFTYGSRGKMAAAFAPNAAAAISGWLRKREQPLLCRRAVESGIARCLLKMPRAGFLSQSTIGEQYPFEGLTCAALVAATPIFLSISPATRAPNTSAQTHTVVTHADRGTLQPCGMMSSRTSPPRGCSPPEGAQDPPVGLPSLPVAQQPTSRPLKQRFAIGFDPFDAGHGGPGHSGAPAPKIWDGR